MSAPALYLLAGAAGLVLVLLILVLLASRKRPRSVTVDLATLEEPPRRNSTYFRLISQAMSPADFRFMADRGSVGLVRRVHKERQRIVLLYLTELRADFDRLLRLAKAISVLSSEVRAVHEIERLRLSLQFSWRYQIVLWALRLDTLLLPQLCGLSVMVSQLAVEMESAVRELGERASVASELASSLERHGLDVA